MQSVFFLCFSSIFFKNQCMRTQKKNSEKTNKQKKDVFRFTSATDIDAGGFLATITILGPFLQWKFQASSFLLVLLSKSNKLPLHCSYFFIGNILMHNQLLTPSERRRVSHSPCERTVRCVARHGSTRDGRTSFCSFPDDNSGKIKLFQKTTAGKHHRSWILP